MRKHYLDNIRWMTVVLVVIYHVVYMFNGIQPLGVIGPFYEVQYQDGIQYLLYPWFMAVLFVVAGVSAECDLKKHTTKEYLCTRTVKLLVPSTLGLFVFWWIMGYYNMLIGGAFESFAMPDTMPGAMQKVMLYLIMSVSGTGPLWFIQVLWIFSVLLLIVRKLEKNHLYNLGKKMGVTGLLACTILCYLSAQIFNTPMIVVYRFGIYGFCFFMGYFVFSHEEVVDQLCKLRIPLLIAALLLGIAYTVIYFGENYSMEPCLNNPLACAYCWMMILAVFACMKFWFDKETPITKWMSEKSWGLYLFHYLPIAMVGYYLKQYAPSLPPVVFYLLSGMAAFLGALLLYDIIRRIPILRWFVLGMRGEKHVSG